MIMLGFLRNAFSSLLSFILVPTIVALVFILSITSVFLNKEAFITTLKANNTFSRIGQDIVPQILVNLGNNEEAQAQIPNEVIVSVVKNLDKSQLAKDLESLVANAHDYVTGKSTFFSTRIAVEPYVKPIAENLQPEVTKYIESLPKCSSAQEQQYLTAKDGRTLSCKPSSKTTEQLLQDLQISAITAELTKNSPKALIVTETEIKTDPEIIKLDQPGQKQKSEKSVLQNLRTAYKNLNSSLGLIAGIIALLSILLFVSRLPQVNSSLKWMSTALFSASIFPLAFGLIILIFAKPEMFHTGLKSLAGADQNSELAIAASSLVGDNLSSFLNKISQALILNSTIIIVIAIVFFLAHLFLRHKTKKPLISGIDSKKQ